MDKIINYIRQLFKHLFKRLLNNKKIEPVIAISKEEPEEPLEITKPKSEKEIWRQNNYYYKGTTIFSRARQLKKAICRKYHITGKKLWRIKKLARRKGLDYETILNHQN